MDFEHVNSGPHRASIPMISVLIGLALSVRLPFVVAQLQLALHLEVSLVDVESFTVEASFLVLPGIRVALKFS